MVLLPEVQTCGKAFKGRDYQGGDSVEMVTRSITYVLPHQRGKNLMSGKFYSIWSFSSPLHSFRFTVFCWRASRHGGKKCLVSITTSPTVSIGMSPGPYGLWLSVHMNVCSSLLDAGPARSPCLVYRPMFHCSPCSV